ncbi:hypothetical protein OAO87_01035 [bacterium]|nr:hypothetical protein [bacterium]
MSITPKGFTRCCARQILADDIRMAAATVLDHLIKTVIASLHQPDAKATAWKEALAESASSDATCRPGGVAS